MILMTKVIRYLLLSVVITSLVGCVSSGQKQIDNAIADYIKNEKSIAPEPIVAIPVVYLLPCIDPLPPADNDMLSIEDALRDAVVSYTECRDSKNALIEQVKNINKLINTKNK